MSLADELLADLEEAAEEEEGGSYGEEEEEPAIEDVQEETQLDLSGAVGHRQVLSAPCLHTRHSREGDTLPFRRERPRAHPISGPFWM